jgi:cell wall-associated NlpC family hydrolase
MTSPDLPQTITTSSVPATSRILTIDQIAAVAVQAGFRAEALITATAISCAEDTSHDPTVINNDPSTGDYSVGLWQINYFGSLLASRTAQFGPPPTLQDPLANAQAAYSLSGGGVNFNPWSTFKSGAYRQFLTIAAQSATNAQNAASLAPPGQSPLLPTPPDATGSNQTVVPATLVDPPVAYPPPWDEIVSKPPTDPASITLADGTKLAPWVILGGQVDLSLTEVSQITFVLADPGLSLYRSLKVGLDDWVRWQGDNWMVSSIQTAQGDECEQLTIVVRSPGAELFKTQRGGPVSGTLGDMLNQCAGLPIGAGPNTPGGVGGPIKAPTALQPLAATSFSVNLDPTLPQDTVNRNTGAGISLADVETDFAMFTRVANSVRAWFFEDQGGFWLGRPSWLISQRPQFKVGWGSGWGGDEGFRAIDCPGCSVDRDTIPRTRQVVVHLPRTRGEQVRPGYRLNLQGIGGDFDLFDPAVTGQPGYIVTKVTWALDHGDTPVEIYAQEPVDPYPTDPEAVAASVQPPTAANNGAPAAGTRQSLDFLHEGLTFDGTPYGTGVGQLDCSLLVQKALAYVGILAPRTSGQQLAWCQQQGTTTTVAEALLTPGALLFAPADGSDHVAISMGDGKNALEAYLPPYGVGVYPVSWQGTEPFAAAAFVPGLVYPGSKVTKIGPV